MRTRLFERESHTFKEVVLDIDETLAVCYVVGSEDELLLTCPNINWFMQNNLYLVAAGTPHILLPGVIEFIQYLHEELKLKLTFFSAGSQERNQEFVEQLLSRAFDKEKYNEICSSILIYSEGHRMVVNPTEGIANAKIQLETLGISSGNYKKDLRVIAKEKVALENKLLIDDNPGIIAFGQEKQVLVVPGSSEEVFEFNPEVSSPSKSDEWVRRANQIFYTTGLLKHILCPSNNNDSYAANKQLFALQYKRVGANFVLSHLELAENKDYYREGLKELQSYNPELTFYGGKQAQAYFNITNKRKLADRT
jgi:hypothetical protein